MERFILMSKDKKGRRWDGRSRIPTQQYKDNYNEIFKKNKEDKKSSNDTHKKSGLSTNIRLEAEIVNGICPTCDEYTPLVGITKQFFRCMTCGSDLEQKVNGVISYIPHLTKQSLQSEVEKYFDGEA